MSLLLEADPNEDKITAYLPDSLCYGVFFDNQCIAVCALLPLKDSPEGKTFELINIAVASDFQSKGIGSQLLGHVIQTMKSEQARKLILGTGTFGYQLAFYQRAGFRVCSVDRDFFLKNYPEPIYENGIQHKDMLRLELDLSV